MFMIIAHRGNSKQQGVNCRDLPERTLMVVTLQMAVGNHAGSE
jgi:glycerophosphoryl diester phosphodiesterase